MKIVVISKDDKELVRIPLARKRLLAGRSPSCEAVVRSKGIKPVQFMIEHVSENLQPDAEDTFFDSESGFWTLVDISGHVSRESEKKSSGMGAGIVLDRQIQNFNGFDFQIVEDTLQETHLKKGVLTRSLGENVGSFLDNANTPVVEIVYFNKDLDIVTNILHLDKNKTTKKLRLFAQLPNFVFEWEEGKTPKAHLKIDAAERNFEIYRRGEQVTDEFLNSKSIEVNNRDIIHVETAEFDFFLRLVPEVKVAVEKFSWARDYMVMTSFFILTVAVVLFFIINSIEPEKTKAKEPPRIIRLELAPPPPPPPQPVEPVQEVMKPEELPQQPVVEDKPDPKAPPEQIKQQVAAAKITVDHKAAPDGKPKSGLNIPAKQKDVNTMGLLAKLKGNSNKTQKVTADKVLTQGTVSETIAGDGMGRVVINKAPSGVVGQSEKAMSPNSLAEASTTLTGASISDADANQSLATTGGRARFSSGTQLNNLKGADKSGEKVKPSEIATGIDLQKNDSMQAVGGLDKEAIRKALRENRRALANCYETALLTKKQLDGRMTYRWVIAIDGTVTTVKLQQSEIGAPTFEACVEAVIKTIQFPQAPNKTTTTVIYPFVFQGKK